MTNRFPRAPGQEWSLQRKTELCKFKQSFVREKGKIIAKIMVPENRDQALKEAEENIKEAIKEG